MRYNKPALTYEQQADQLLARGLIADRVTLLNRGIRPESLPPVEDVKKVERRLDAAAEKTIKKPDKLAGQ